MPIQFTPYLNKQIICTLIASILYLVCCVLEYLSFRTVYDLLGSSCISFYEISQPIMYYLLFNSVPLIPDAAFAVMGLILYRLHMDPIGVLYNLVVGIICITNAVLLKKGLTYCGNPVQDDIAGVGPLILAAGVVHLIAGVFIHFTMEKGETYIWLDRFRCKSADPAGEGEGPEQSSKNPSPAGSKKLPPPKVHPPVPAVPTPSPPGKR